mmetsp:Transcript_12090/g.39452  ORF Transcript_12090/g.39452 Transcript_12090/m.39452 type:complete len:146 (-) Transcript_12090:131-568(-)
MLSVRGEQVEELRRVCAAPLAAPRVGVYRCTDTQLVWLCVARLPSQAASEIDPLGSEPSALPPVVTVDISDGSTSMSHFSLDGVRQLVAALTEDLRAPSSPPLPGLAPLPPRPDEPPPQLPQSLVGARSRSTAMAIRSVTPQPDD